MCFDLHLQPAKRGKAAGPKVSFPGSLYAQIETRNSTARTDLPGLARWAPNCGSLSAQTVAWASWSRDQPSSCFWHWHRRGCGMSFLRIGGGTAPSCRSKPGALRAFTNGRLHEPEMTDERPRLNQQHLAVCSMAARCLMKGSYPRPRAWLACCKKRSVAVPVG